MKSTAAEISHPPSSGRLITVGASRATSTPTGPELEPSRQRSTRSSTLMSLTSSQRNQPSHNPPTTNRRRVRRRSTVIEPYQDRSSSVENRVEDLLARLTVEDKAGLM